MVSMEENYSLEASPVNIENFLSKKSENLKMKYKKYKCAVKSDSKPPRVIVGW